MPEQTIPAHGAVCWNELSTTNVEAAKSFYSELLGWTLKESQIGTVNYTEFYVGGKPSGGMVQMGAEFGNMPSHWMAYIAVEDVDASVKRVEALGGKVCVPPTDIPNTGRFCVINDPTGATISLITMTGANS
ncbi:MAG TPA: VOC family protein [Pyrinomonadaceae bacterium]|nr:VOC family protein [Pyrinomonadaceae bacterium]